MTQRDDQPGYPEALTRIEQSLARIEQDEARIQTAADLAAHKIEAASKAAAEDAVKAATQIAVLIERVSTHIERKDLHGESGAIIDLKAEMRGQRKWILGVLVSALAALAAVIWKFVGDHIAKGTP